MSPLSAFYSLVVGFFTNILVETYSLTGNLGTAIIVLTLVIRFLLIPFSLPSLRVQKKMKAIQPALKELKKKHQGDTKAFNAAQMELYKQHNVNPLGGCLPQLGQIVVAFFFYGALRRLLHETQINGINISPEFLWLNLTRPDSFFLLPVLVGLSQFVLSLMIAPAAETPDIIPNDSSNKKVKAANKKEEDMAEMAATMQQQMIFTMPIVFGITSISFSGGLSLYMIVTTVFSIVQQYIVSGPGGLVLYAQRAKTYLQSRLSNK